MAIKLVIKQPGLAGDPLLATSKSAATAGDFLEFVSSIVLTPASGGKTKAVITVDEVEVDLASPPVTI